MLLLSFKITLPFTLSLTVTLTLALNLTLTPLKSSKKVICEPINVFLVYFPSKSHTDSMLNTQSGIEGKTSLKCTLNAIGLGETEEEDSD